MFPFTTDRALPLGVRMRSELRHGLCPPASALPSYSAANMRQGSRSSATSSWKILKPPAELSENYGREAADGEPRIAHTTGINLRREAYRFGQLEFHSRELRTGRCSGSLTARRGRPRRASTVRAARGRLGLGDRHGEPVAALAASLLHHTGQWLPVRSVDGARDSLVGTDFLPRLRHPPIRPMLAAASSWAGW